MPTSQEKVRDEIARFAAANGVPRETVEAHIHATAMQSGIDPGRAMASAASGGIEAFNALIASAGGVGNGAMQTTGGMGRGLPPANVPSTSEAKAVEDYIEQVAIEIGVDPAMVARVAQAEGLDIQLAGLIRSGAVPPPIPPGVATRPAGAGDVYLGSPSTAQQGQLDQWRAALLSNVFARLSPQGLPGRGTNVTRDIVRSRMTGG